MRWLRFGLAGLTVLSAFLARPAGAELITVEVDAYIDGRDQLTIQSNTLQWHHFDTVAAAVGRHFGRNEPTVISTTLDGIPVLNNVEWIPEWPLPPPAEIRYEALSSVFTGLAPAIPQHEMDVTLEALQARAGLEIVQFPSSANDYTTIVQFNDNAPLGPEYYRCRLTFIPEPCTIVLLSVGVVGLLAYACRRKRAA